MATKTMAKKAAAESKGHVQPGGNIERFLALSDAEKAAVASRYERGVPASELSDLSPAERERWEASAAATRASRAGRAADRRGTARPAGGNGSRSVTVTVDGDLLDRATAYAKAMRVDRSQLFAAGLVLVLAAGVAGRADGQ